MRHNASFINRLTRSSQKRKEVVRLDGLVQLKVIALQVCNPGKEPFTSWIATVMLLFDWTSRHASCLELGEKARQVVNTIIDQILSTLSTQWPFCRHDGKHRTVTLRGIRIVTVVEFHVIGIGALREKLQAEVQRIPVSQPLRILSVDKHTSDAIDFDHALLLSHQGPRSGVQPNCVSFFNRLARRGHSWRRVIASS